MEVPGVVVVVTGKGEETMADGEETEAVGVDGVREEAEAEAGAHEIVQVDLSPNCDRAAVVLV
jgi:hypothetical protein